MTRGLTIAAIAAVLCLAASVWAQDPAATPPATQPADLSRDDSLKGVDANLTPEQLEAMLKTATENRLKAERQLVAAELKNGDPIEAKEAAAILEKDVKSTQADNIEKICQAFAQVDSDFGKVYKLFNEKDYAKVVEIVKGKKLISEEEKTFLNAARAWVYARAWEELKKPDQAADAYTTICDEMTERLSFAADSALRRAQVYDRVNRGLYAMEYYAYFLKNYGLTIDGKTFDEIYDKVQKYKEVYGDPMGSVAKMMSTVKERLAGVDSGKETQVKEEEIVALLTDLIKTTEDQQQQQQQQQNRQRAGQKGEKKGEGQGKGEGKGEGQGKGQGKGNQHTDNPSSPAQQSMLRLGDTRRPGRLSDIHSGEERGDWSTMPPEMKKKLEELHQKMVGERYKDEIEAYRKALAEAKVNP